MSTLTIDIVDMTVPKYAAVNIAVVNQPNPVEGYTANADEVYQLINIPKYRITESATGTVVTGENYYTYFPEMNPGGGGGGGGGGDSYSRAEIDRMMLGKVDKVNGKGLSTNDYTNSDKTKVTTSQSSTEVTNAIEASQTAQEQSLIALTKSDVTTAWNSDVSDKVLITYHSSGDTTVVGSYQELIEWLDDHPSDLVEVSFGDAITEELPIAAFNKRTTIVKMYIGEKCMFTQAGTFASMSELTELVIKAPVLTLTQGCVSLCTKLETIVLPDTIKTFAPGSITSVTDGFVTKGHDTFVFPADLETIESGAMSSVNIEHVVFNDKLKTLSSGWLTNNTSSGTHQTKTVTIPSSIETIGPYAFSPLNATLQKITINKPEGSVSGAPWGASNNVTIEWTG
jgi:hypothetical protein